MKYEKVEEAEGQKFPHFYGPDGKLAPIDVVAAVVASTKLALSPDGGKHVISMDSL